MLTQVVPLQAEVASAQDGQKEFINSASASHIGQALIAAGKLKQEDVEKILQFQQKKNLLFGEAAIALGLIKQPDLEKVLSEQYEYTYLQDNSKIDDALVAAHSPFGVEAEKLRSLRGQLLLRWFDLGHKTLAVTSTESADKANLVASNLAIVFSQLNKKTLLIDANLRQPSQHHLFAIETRLGLSNILANREGSYQLARHPGLANLSVLTAGTEVPNPQELLSKSNFASLLSDLEGVFDIILIDVPPANFGSDYLAIVSKAKACVIVTRKDYTKALELQSLTEQLTIAGTSVVGSILQEI